MVCLVGKAKDENGCRASGADLEGACGHASVEAGGGDRWGVAALEGLQSQLDHARSRDRTQTSTPVPVREKEASLDHAGGQTRGGQGRVSSCRKICLVSRVARSESLFGCARGDR